MLAGGANMAIFLPYFEGMPKIIMWFSGASGALNLYIYVYSHMGVAETSQITIVTHALSLG